MLTSKQKSYLRSLAQTEPALFQIGKEGLSDNLLSGISDYLKANELVKVSVLKSCDTSINEIEIDVCSTCKCELVQCIGRTLIFYRRSKEHKIVLP